MANYGGFHYLAIQSFAEIQLFNLYLSPNIALFREFDYFCPVYFYHELECI